jgi:sortase A
VTATSPTTGLPDGRAVTVNVKANPDVLVFAAEVRQCRAGVTYQERADILPSGGKCPDKPVSSTADQVVLRSGSVSDAVHTDAGVTIPFKVGVGTVPIVPIGTGPGTLTCDESNPCVLVVQLSLAGGQFAYSTIPLTFVNDEVLAACGGPATGVLASGGSDQMQDAWAQWTKDVCKRPGAAGAPSRAAFLGEGAAVQAFAAGQLDLAYTAVGYDNAVGLVAGLSQRTAVATPVALNAAVIAVGGGYITPSGAKAPYPEIKMTAAEVAALFGGGLPWVQRDNLPYAASILGRNPVLGGFLSAEVPANRPMLPSGAESSTWLLTNFLTQRSPTHWIAPREGNAPRGAVAAAATAEPKFGDDDTYTGRPVLGKVTEGATASVSTRGPIWALTDLATAEALGMTPVSIENANGEFVRPTAESMAAAVSTMKPDENGLLLPDPAAVTSSAPTDTTSAAATVTPYPLTYVEYAFAPAEPLVDVTTCTARTASQILLTNWLAYLVGDGQKNLAAGFAALTPALIAQATATVSQVGAAPLTGPCAGQLAASGPGGPSGASPGTGIPSGRLPAAGVSALPRTGTPTGAAASPTAAAAAGDGNELAIAIPAFAGHKLADTTGNVVALVGIVLVTSLAAWVTAGRRAGAGSLAMAGGGGAVGVGAPRARSNVGGLVLLWFGVALAGVGLVVYQLGPLLQQRDQRDLLSEYRTSLRQASKETSGLPGASTATKPPAEGDAVGVVEIGELQAQQVVVEGVTPSETRKGPGHVPGTAGLGQPGNAAVVARRNAFGGSFAELATLRKGDRILVTTTQGQSVYAVRTVSTRTIEDPPSESSSSTPTAKEATDKSVTLDSLYGPSKDDRLTLVTSASRAPWNSSEALVVVARMDGKPFAPTPQNGRSDGETGRNAESGVLASVAFAVLLYGGAIAASVLLYRRMRFRVAYILTIAPLVALTVITGETFSRLLPAWM